VLQSGSAGLQNGLHGDIDPHSRALSQPLITGLSSHVLFTSIIVFGRDISSSTMGREEKKYRGRAVICTSNVSALNRTIRQSHSSTSFGAGSIVLDYPVSTFILSKSEKHLVRWLYRSGHTISKAVLSPVFESISWTSAYHAVPLQVGQVRFVMTSAV
jgi:hypothetical protein